MGKILFRCSAFACLVIAADLYQLEGTVFRVAMYAVLGFAAALWQEADRG